MNIRSILLCSLTALISLQIQGIAAEPASKERSASRAKRVLLIGQEPDGHPFGTHEYMSSTRILAACLQKSERIQTIVAQADGDWAEGPELIDGADSVVVFVSQGAKWIQEDARRLQAFQDHAKRGGGLIVLHWGMGTRDADDIPAFVNLFGGCHGGPDRRYKVVDVTTEIASPQHPILAGVESIPVHEEFYYTLKFPKPPAQITHLIRVPIEGEKHTVAWAWERPDGGRSFGFSGLHFHDNWKLRPYRRMVTQAILWSVEREMPEDGIDVEIADEIYVVPAREEKAE